MSARQAGMLQPGSQAPDFRLTDLDQRTHSLKEMLAQGPVVLAFFKGSCPVCQFTFPFLERMHQGRAADAPRIFAVSQDKPDTTREFNQRFGITIPTLLDPADRNYPASNGFQITNVPSIFRIEPDGQISQSISGFHRAEMEELGAKLGVKPFRPDEQVPEVRPG
jgi:peroxiredoxin